MSEVTMERFDSDSSGAIAKMTHEDHPGIVFTLHIGASKSLVRFAVDSTLGPPLTSRYLRTLPIGQMHDAVVAEQLAAETLDDPIPVPFVGRARYKQRDQKLAALAAEYVHLLRRGEPAALRIAEHRGWTVHHARQEIWHARQRELLTPTPSGKQGGLLTDRARGLLGWKQHESA